MSILFKNSKNLSPMNFSLKIRLMFRRAMLTQRSIPMFQIQRTKLEWILPLLLIFHREKWARASQVHHSLIIPTTSLLTSINRNLSSKTKLISPSFMGNSTSCNNRIWMSAQWSNCKWEKGTLLLQFSPSNTPMISMAISTSLPQLISSSRTSCLSIQGRWWISNTQGILHRTNIHIQCSNINSIPSTTTTSKLS